MYEIGFVKDPFNYFSEIRKIEDTPQFTFNKFDFFLLPREREHSNNNHQRMFVEMTKCLHKRIFVITMTDIINASRGICKILQISIFLYT